MRTSDFAIGEVGRSTLGFRVHVLGILDLLGCCIQDISSDIFRTFSDQIECTRFYPRLKQGRDSKILIVHLLFVKQIFWLFSIMDLHKSLWTFSESLLIKPSMEYVDSRYIVMLWIDLNQNGYAEWFLLIPEIPWDLPLPPLNFEWFMKVSSIICSICTFVLLLKAKS